MPSPTRPSQRRRRRTRDNRAPKLPAFHASGGIGVVPPIQAEANPLRIFVAPGRFDQERGRRYNVHLGSPEGEKIVTDALDTAYAACRVLSARGVTGALEVWNVGSAFPSMYVRDIAVAARFTVREDRFHGPIRVRYRPRRASDAPVRGRRKRRAPSAG